MYSDAPKPTNDTIIKTYARNSNHASLLLMSLFKVSEGHTSAESKRLAVKKEPMKNMYEIRAAKETIVKTVFPVATTP